MGKVTIGPNMARRELRSTSKVCELMRQCMKVGIDFQITNERRVDEAFGFEYDVIIFDMKYKA